MNVNYDKSFSILSIKGNHLLMKVFSAELNLFDSEISRYQNPRGHTAKVGVICKF